MTISISAPRKLYIDHNEPQVIKRLIAPIKDVNFEWGPYNTQGHSDYWWERHDGIIKEVERKTWQEILSNLERIEEQLSRHLETKPNAEHILLLEGPIMQIGDKIGTFRTNGLKFEHSRDYQQNLGGIYSWLYQISHYYTIVPSYNINTTAAALVGMFKSDGKLNHSTLQRNYHIRTFNRDPVIERYMGMLDGISEKRAETLRKTFPTVKDLVGAHRNDIIILPGFGPAIADKIMRQLGTFSAPKVHNV